LFVFHPDLNQIVTPERMVVRCVRLSRLHHDEERKSSVNYIIATRRASLRGFWFVLLAAVLWGTVGATAKAIYADGTASPLTVSLMRLAIATPILALSCWKLLGQRMFGIERRDLALMALSGLCIAGSHAAYFVAVSSVGVAIATLATVCTAPIIVAGFSVLLKQEQLTRRVTVSLVGTVALVGFQTEVELNQNSVFGILFALGSAFGYAGMIVCGRYLAQRYHSLQITTVQFSAGTLVSLGANLFVGTHFNFSTGSWTLLLYLGIVTTALAYGLFVAGVQTISGTSASIMTLGEPLTAVLLAWLIFGEQLDMSGLIGALLLVFSFLMLASPERVEADS
jgi:DME family drug/metabolite transporter